MKIRLQEIGFSEGESKVYNALLEIGVSSLQKIQEKTGVDRRNIYDILNKLTEKGLVSYTTEKGKMTFQITHPNKLLNYLEEKKHEIQEKEEKVKTFLPNLLQTFNQKKENIRAEVFRGNEAMKALLEDVLNYKESYWIGGNSGVEKTNFDIWFSHWMKKRAKRKHIMYDLVDKGVFLKGFEPHKKELHKKNLYKYKELPEGMNSPLVMVIFGQKVAQILWSDQSFAFVVESQEIKDSFKKYFDYFWQTIKTK